MEVLGNQDRYLLTVAILECYLDGLISARQARFLAAKLSLPGFLKPEGE